MKYIVLGTIIFLMIIIGVILLRGIDKTCKRPNKNDGRPPDDIYPLW